MAFQAILTRGRGVDDEQIAEVLGNWTSIPVFKEAHRAETTRLLRMEEELHKRIIGQEDAVKMFQGHPAYPGRAEAKRPSGAHVHLRQLARCRSKTELSRRWPTSCSVTTTRSLFRLTWVNSTTGSPRRRYSAPPGCVSATEGSQLTEGAAQAVLGSVVRARG